MTNSSDDRIAEVVAAFLDYLHGEGEEPSLDDLGPEERAQADELIANLKAARGINPYASPPSLEQLLAGTPLEHALQGETVAVEVSEGELLRQVRAQLDLYSPFHASVWRDLAAETSDVRSDFVALIGPHRLRIQVRDDLEDVQALAALDPADAAGAVYGRFPDTAGVIVMYPDEDLSSVAIDPFDPEYCIEIPGGSLERPVIHRPILPFESTVRLYLEEVAPSLDATAERAAIFEEDLDPADLALEVATQAVNSVIDEGRRARIDIKKNTWSALGQAEITAINGTILAALADELTEAELIERITDLGDAA